MSYGVAQDIPRYRLHDILHKLRTITLDTFPLFRAAHTFIGNRLSAEKILSHPKLHIGEPPHGRQRDKEHPTLALKTALSKRGRLPLFHRSLYRPVHIPREPHDVRICRPPQIHKRLQFFLHKSHLDRAYQLQSVDRATISPK